MIKKMTYLLVLFLLSIQIHASNNLFTEDDPCLPPVNIEVTAITTYSIEFEWEGADESDASTLFQYTITEDGNPLGGPTTIENQAASTGYLPLSPSTTYNLYLRTLCMGDWSDWSDAVSFTTAACDTVDMPYFQDFETLTSFNLVECTGGEVISGNYWNVNQTATGGFNGNTLSYLANETQDANSWYIIQSGINITEDDKVKVSFKYGGDGNGSETIRLFMATSIDDFTSGDGLQISDLTFSDDTLNEYVAGPIPFTSTDVYYFAFQVLSDANQGTIYVDDFKVEEWTCGVPEEITADDISADSVTLSWDATGNNQVHFYQYTVSTNADEPDDSSSDIIATGSAINNLVENLNPNTVYYVYVRASCSGVWSDWSQSINFVTLCDTSSVLLPVGLVEQTLEENQTLGNLEVEGEDLTWYVDQELTIEIPVTTVAQDATTYYVTQTIDGCTSQSLAITVTVLDPCADITLPTGDTEQTLEENQTLGNLAVEGENLTWYADQELTIEIPSTTVAQDATTYYVTQTIDGCISEALAITVEVTLSINGTDTPLFIVYPNPVKNILNISYSENIVNVDVLNMLGQTVISKKVNANDIQIDMSELPTGNYFAKVSTNNAVKILKIIRK